MKIKSGYSLDYVKPTYFNYHSSYLQYIQSHIWPYNEYFNSKRRLLIIYPSLPIVALYLG